MKKEILKYLKTNNGYTIFKLADHLETFVNDSDFQITLRHLINEKKIKIVNDLVSLDK